MTFAVGLAVGLLVSVLRSDDRAHIYVERWWKRARFTPAKPGMNYSKVFGQP